MCEVKILKLRFMVDLLRKYLGVWDLYVKLGDTLIIFVLLIGTVVEYCFTDQELEFDYQCNVPLFGWHDSSLLTTSCSLSLISRVLVLKFIRGFAFVVETATHL
ncbi:hypothetical protein M9H77_13218 [Catharanthus roseus]|uniref:Uncharacterized protein n=1 Tax=Catharanthus roseus TaxID=4058 RepID=A0ACC0BJP6_CATRO|nr:hypothetical protein M9H77_13218 [Catharanthus roseus]